MENTILLIVDVQTFLISHNPHNKTEVIANIKKLLDAARNSSIEVVYVRHDDGKGSPLEYGSDGWQIYSEVAPAVIERIFDKKFSSSFRQTGLREYLDAKGIKNIILVGMQTDYCVDTTCRVAFEFGYRVIIPAGSTTTFSNSLATAENIIKYYETKLWNGRFAEVVSIDEALSMIENK